jgi:hypothetical protein
MEAASLLNMREGRPYATSEDVLADRGEFCLDGRHDHLDLLLRQAAVVLVVEQRVDAVERSPSSAFAVLGGAVGEQRVLQRHAERRTRLLELLVQDGEDDVCLTLACRLTLGVVRAVRCLLLRLLGPADRVLGVLSCSVAVHRDGTHFTDCLSSRIMCVLRGSEKYAYILTYL